MRPLRFLMAVLALAVGIGTATQASTETRLALVIGNSSYENADYLRNPINDAEAVAAVLARVGFEVDIRLDLDYRAMQEALRNFGVAAEQADVALVFYAGHGIQVGAENYLLPVDARLERERDLIYEALPVGVLLGEAAQAKRLGMVILDACRDNPLAEQLRQILGPIRSQLVGQGLARVENLPPDTMIAFSTRPGEVAVDGEGEHSPYTAALLQHLEEPGLELNLMFRKVRDTVLAATAFRQEPRTFDALGAEPFYFKARKPNQRPVLPRLEVVEVVDDQAAVPLGIPAPTDPDDDPLSAQVTGLPRSGQIKVGGQPVLIGDVLTVAQLTAATYSPVRGEAGDAGSFDVLVRDDRGGAVIGSVPILVTRANQPPTVALPTALALPAIPLSIPPPVDPDGDPLTITVAEVPAQGVVRSGERALVPGDQLSPQELAGLVLEPGPGGAAGRFAFRVADDRGASVTATLRLTVPALPELQVGTETVLAARETPQPPPLASATRDDGARTFGAREPAIVAEPAGPAEPAIAPAAPQPTAPAEPAVVAMAPEPATAAAPAEVDPNEYVTTRPSNIRSGPSADSERVTTVGAGVVLRVAQRAEGRDWFWVRTEDGHEGFIYGQLIEPRPAPSSPMAPAPASPVPAAPASPEAGAPAPEPTVQPAAAPVARISAAGLKECEDCPEMAMIPAGSFVMGSERGHWSEQPTQQVTIDRPFALGKYEVTAGQWQACVAAGACEPLEETDQGNPRAPMRNVSWDDAQTYVRWLAEVTGKPYRLPSEAEWEYAARAGSDTAFWWGEEVGRGQAACADCDGTEEPAAAPTQVGAFPANPFGLHDMHGNVMEWVADCWFPNHEGAPEHGAARLRPGCTQRVLRGGSWSNDHSYATASSRLSYDAALRYPTNGFRVARDLK